MNNTTPARQRQPVTRFTLVNVASPVKVLQLALSSADSVTIERDGSFTAWFDDYAADTRLVARYHGGHTQYKVTSLYGYSEEKHCWTREVAVIEVEMPDRRGQAGCRKLHVQMSTEQGHVIPGARTVHLYRNADWSWKK